MMGVFQHQQQRRLNEYKTMKTITNQFLFYLNKCYVVVDIGRLWWIFAKQIEALCKMIEIIGVHHRKKENN